MKSSSYVHKKSNGIDAFFLHVQSTTTFETVTHDVLDVVGDTFFSETIGDWLRCGSLVIKLDHFSRSSVLGPCGKVHALGVRILGV